MNARDSLNTLTLLRRTAADAGYAVLGAADLAFTLALETAVDAPNLPRRAHDLQEQALTLGRQTRSYLDSRRDELVDHGRQVAARLRGERPGVVSGEVVDSVITTGPSGASGTGPAERTGDGR